MNIERIHRWTLSALAGAVLAFPNPALAQCERASTLELFASDGATLDTFARDVAMNDDWIVAGAPGLNGSIGSVYVYDRGPTPTEIKLNDPDGTGVLFGWSVGVWEQWLVVGDPGWDSDRGRVSIFEWDGATWSLNKEFKGTAGDQLGFSVSISDTRLAVGMPEHNLTGAVKLFEWSGVSWLFKQKLEPPLGAVGGRFGESVSYRLPMLIVGNPNPASVGSFYGYHWKSSLVTPYGQTIDPDVDMGKRFGTSVHTDGTNAIIGKPLDSESGGGAGAAYMFFEFLGSWNLGEKLLPPPGSDGAQFGTDVALNQDVALMSGPGAVVDGQITGMVRQYRVTSLAGFVEQASMIGNDINNLFGLAVALDDTEVLVGAPYDSGVASTTGSAYRFPMSDFELHVTPESIPLFDPVTATTCGGTPGALLGMFVTGVDGIPVFIALTFGYFQGDGTWTLAGAHTNPAYSGITLDVMGLSTNPGGKVTWSNTVAVELQ